MLLLSFAGLFQNNFSKNYFRNTIRLSNGLDRVGPDLGPKCLHSFLMLSANDKSSKKG